MYKIQHAQEKQGHLFIFNTKHTGKIVKLQYCKIVQS